MQIKKWGAIFVALATLCLVANVSRAQEPKLTVGSKAPPLDIEHWLQDGEGKFKPVTEFEKDKVYVVEFWATWCGPCVASMPHLAQLQTEYADKGVQIISISDEPLDTVTAFLEKKPDPNSDKTFADITRAYCLTTDPDGSSHRDFMEAAQQAGIPTSFLIGKTGLIEWIGHPMELDRPLKMVVAGTWDREAEQKKKKEVDDAVKNIEQLANTGKFAESIEAIDELVKKLEPDHRLQGSLQRLRQQLIPLSGTKEAVAILSEEQRAAGDNPEQLHQVAWKAALALERNDAIEGEVKKEYLKIALESVEKALEAKPDAAPFLFTYARLLHKKGDLDKAIEVQTKAVDASTGRTKQFLSQFLLELKAEKESADGTSDKEGAEESDK